MAQTEIQARRINSDALGKQSFLVAGRTALDTGGGTQVVTVTGAQLDDIVIVSLEYDDEGTPITSLVGYISALDTLTIVRTDDGSSTDTGYASYMVMRP